VKPKRGTTAAALGHVSWLVDTKKKLKTLDGKPVEVWELRHANDAAVLSAWAAHFRRHYCRDEQLDELRAGYKLSRAEYLTKIKFPDASSAPGPSIRAGDFAEILAADYLEYLLGHWVPRTRYVNKTIRNESTKGSDVLGFKMTHVDRETRDDTLVIMESKAQLTGDRSNGKLQEAVNDSAKDLRRKAESLNALKQRLLDEGKVVDARRIDRFQNPVDHPYNERYGAVAVLATPVFDPSDIAATDASSHPRSGALFLVIIHAQAVMQLVHALYERAANEA
jgi:hypothetical protein